VNTYQCENPACGLGTTHQPGKFTGGISHHHMHLLTGNPIPDDVEDPHAPLEGFCPNCGMEGALTDG